MTTFHGFYDGSSNFQPHYSNPMVPRCPAIYIGSNLDKLTDIQSPFVDMVLSSQYLSGILNTGWSYTLFIPLVMPCINRDDTGLTRKFGLSHLIRRYVPFSFLQSSPDMVLTTSIDPYKLHLTWVGNKLKLNDSVVLGYNQFGHSIIYIIDKPLFDTNSINLT
jgi:hypothetical protein